MPAELHQQLQGLGHGDHLCLLYDTPAEQLAAALPFVREGLVRGECCAYIADEHSTEEIARELRKLGVQVDRELARGALRLLTKQEAYLRSGEFDPEGMIAFLQETAEQALAAGFTAFRVTGEMSWALGPETGCSRVIEYEALLNQYFPGSRVLAICQYNRRRFSADVIHNVLRTHPTVVVGGEVCPNPFYEPPEMVLEAPTLPGTVSWARVEWMIGQLHRARMAELTRQELTEQLSQKTTALEAQLHKQRRTETLERGQKEALEQIVRGAPLAEVLDGLARTAEEEAGAGTRVAIMLYDEEARCLRHGAAPSVPEAYCRAVDGIGAAVGVGSCAEAAATGRRVIVEDIATHPNWAGFRELALNEGYRAAWSQPILSAQGRVLGTFGIYYLDARGPSARDLEVGEILSRTASVAIERFRTERALRESEEFSRRILESTRDCIKVLDLDGRILFMSEVGLRALELDSVEGCLGGRWADYWPLEDREAAEAAVAAARGGGVGHFQGYLATLKSGQPRWWDVVLSPILDERGRPERLLAISRDVTEQRKQRARLEEAEATARARAEALAETDRRKDEFLAMLAHELRNPLAPIMNTAELLRHMAAGAPALERPREIIARNARHLSRMVDDLLEVSRINQGKIELRRERLDLARVIEQAVGAVRSLTGERGQELSVALPPEPVWLWADPTRVTQVFVNLLQNAAKYTPEGGRIALVALREGDEAVVQVRDNGRGIEPELLGRVFDLFVQGEQTLARPEGGLGIGLTLVHRLVALHGGSVAAQSPGRGRGSEFTVRLPVEPAPAAPVAEATAPVTPTGGYRILIAEDNRDAAETLADLLGMWGYEVRVAHDGPSALEAAAEYRPMVLLLDLGLPGYDGFELARRLRARWGTAGVLVALTGYSDEEHRRRAHAAGFDHHLAKPVDLSLLHDFLSGIRRPTEALRQ